MEIFVAFLVLLGVAAGLNHLANRNKPENATRKALRKQNSGSGRKSGVSEPKRSEGVELTFSVEGAYGDSDSYEKIEREASKRAFSRVIPETLDEYTREQLAGAWMRDRRSGGDLVSDFEIILAGTNWQWPWLEKSRAEFQKEGVGPDLVYVDRVYRGSPRPASNHRELIGMVKVAEIRTWLKEHDRYPSPAPKKRAEFDALLLEQPWVDLQPWALQIFEDQRAALEKRYEKDRVSLLAGTLNHAK